LIVTDSGLLILPTALLLNFSFMGANVSFPLMVSVAMNAETKVVMSGVPHPLARSNPVTASNPVTPIEIVVSQRGIANAGRGRVLHVSQLIQTRVDAAQGRDGGYGPVRVLGNDSSRQLNEVSHQTRPVPA
jgi:hypothetical protein